MKLTDQLNDDLIINHQIVISLIIYLVIIDNRIYLQPLSARHEENVKTLRSNPV